ncbi:hypothetical protein KI387_043493, partial [Taxus chinensis]
NSGVRGLGRFGREKEKSTFDFGILWDENATKYDGSGEFRRPELGKARTKVPTPREWDISGFRPIGAQLATFVLGT